MAGFAARGWNQEDIDGEAELYQLRIAEENRRRQEEERIQRQNAEAIVAQEAIAEIKGENRNLFHDRLRMDGFNPDIFDNMLKISKAIVAGGYPLQVFSKDSWPSDIDLWIPSNRDGGEPAHIYRYLMDLGYTPKKMELRCSNVRSKSADIQTCEMDYMRFNKTVGYMIAFYKPNAITVQMIVLKTGLSPVEMVKTFDLDICQVMYMNGAISFTEEGLSDRILQKRAAISRAALDMQSTYEWFRTFKRIDKYMMRGYTIDTTAMLKVLEIKVPQTVHSISRMADKDTFIYTWNRSVSWNLVAQLKLPVFIELSEFRFAFAYVREVAPNIEYTSADIIRTIANVSTLTLTLSGLNDLLINEYFRIRDVDMVTAEVPVVPFDCSLRDPSPTRNYEQRPIYIQGIDVCMTAKQACEPLEYMFKLVESQDQAALFYRRDAYTNDILKKFILTDYGQIYYCVSDKHVIPIDNYCIFFKSIKFNAKYYTFSPTNSLVYGTPGDVARFGLLEDAKQNRYEEGTIMAIRNVPELSEEGLTSVLKEIEYYNPRFDSIPNEGRILNDMNIHPARGFDPEEDAVFIIISMQQARYSFIGLINQQAVRELVNPIRERPLDEPSDIELISSQLSGVLTCFPLIRLYFMTSPVDALSILTTVEVAYRIINAPNNTIATARALSRLSTYPLEYLMGGGEMVDNWPPSDVYSILPYGYATAEQRENIMNVMNDMNPNV